MPQYREPLKLRILQAMVDVVRHYPENASNRRLWSDRMFYRDPLTRETFPLSVLWQDGGPRVAQHFVTAMQLVRWRGVRSVFVLPWRIAPAAGPILRFRFSAVPPGSISARYVP